MPYRVEIGEETERRRAVDPERQEVLQLGMSLRLEGSSWQCQGAQEGVGLALGEGTYRTGENIWTRKTSGSLRLKGMFRMIFFLVILHLGFEWSSSAQSTS